MDKTTSIHSSISTVQEVGRMAKRRRAATVHELKVIVIRPETPNLEALDQVYEILATTKTA